MSNEKGEDELRDYRTEEEKVSGRERINVE